MLKRLDGHPIKDHISSTAGQTIHGSSQRASQSNPNQTMSHDRTVPNKLRASFLRSEDQDEDIDQEGSLGDVEPGLNDVSNGSSNNTGLGIHRTSSSSKGGTNNGSSGNSSLIGIHRTSSGTFRALCSSFRDKNPHQLAASVSSGVKQRFCDSLPESLLQNYDNRDCIAPFSSDEIVLGKKLGSGEFSHVFKIKSFRLNSSFQGSMSKEECDMREYMKGRETYRDTKKSTYALKHLRPELLDKYKPAEYAQFASDLVQEAEFLSLLQHPNIIKLRGTSFMDFNGFEQGPKGYFLIIDRLEETLTDRIAKWKGGSRRTNLGMLQSQLTSLSKAAKKNDTADEGDSLFSQQLEVVLQIAAAMLYLHEKNIIFRDLKPANVGFDVRGKKYFVLTNFSVLIPYRPFYDMKVISACSILGLPK
jgi:hypothetical protein